MKITMYISHISLIATLISGYGACYAFAPRTFNSKSNLSIRGSTSQLFASTDDQNIVIIGGGVAGLSIAHNLKKNDKDVKVTLLDKESSVELKDGGSATSCSLCFIYPRFGFSQNGIVENLIIKGNEMHREWRNEIGYNGSIENQGVVLPTNENYIELALALNTDLSENKVKSDDIEKVSPLLNKAVEEWLYFKESEKLNAQDLLTSLRTACENEGVVLNLGEKWNVESLKYDDDGKCTGVELGSGEELLGTVVAANGASLSMLMKDKSGNDLKVFPVIASQSQHLVLKSEDIPYMPVRALSSKAYVIPRPDGEVFVGDSGGQLEPTDTVEACLANAKEMVPTVDTLPVERTYKAIRGFTADDVPLLGIDNDTGVYVAGGLNGYGVTVAPYIAEVVGTLIRNGGSLEGITGDVKQTLSNCMVDRSSNTTAINHVLW